MRLRHALPQHIVAEFLGLGAHGRQGGELAGKDGVGMGFFVILTQYTTHPARAEGGTPENSFTVHVVGFTISALKPVWDILGAVLLSLTACNLLQHGAKLSTKLCTT